MFTENTFKCCGQDFSFFEYKRYTVSIIGKGFMLEYNCKDGDKDFLEYFDNLNEVEEHVKKLEYIRIKNILRFKRYINHFSNIYKEGKYKTQGRPPHSNIKKKSLARKLKPSTSRRYKSYGYLNAMRGGMSRHLIRE